MLRAYGRALGLIPILVMALAFGAYVASTSTINSLPVTQQNGIPTTTNLTWQEQDFSAGSSTTNDSLGLTFTLELNSTEIFQGQTMNITAFVTNDRSSINNVTRDFNWEVGVGWGAIDSCNSFANAQVYHGYYTQSNLSTIQGGAELQLAKPIFPPMECPFIPGAWSTYFPFQPDQSRVGYQYSAQGSYGNVSAAISGQTGFNLFSPGTYTVVSGDEWGQIAILHFVVLKDPVQVVSVVGPIVPINPGGPTINITLENANNIPIISLNSSLDLPSAEPSVPYLFAFDVSSSNPLQFGHVVQSSLTLIGASFDSSSTYPLTISGMLSNGVQFSFTEQVSIEPPS
jgi:hypothetical protein